jgi:hypothetical protein
MMGSKRRQEPDPVYVRRFAAEIGARYRGFQDRNEISLPENFRMMLDQLEKAEEASPDRRT